MKKALMVSLLACSTSLAWTSAKAEAISESNILNPDKVEAAKNETLRNHGGLLESLRTVFEYQDLFNDTINPQEILSQLGYQRMHALIEDRSQISLMREKEPGLFNMNESPVMARPRISMSEQGGHDTLAVTAPSMSFIYSIEDKMEEQGVDLFELAEEKGRMLTLSEIADALGLEKKTTFYTTILRNSVGTSGVYCRKGRPVTVDNFTEQCLHLDIQSNIANRSEEQTVDLKTGYDTSLQYTYQVNVDLENNTVDIAGEKRARLEVTAFPMGFSTKVADLKYSHSFSRSDLEVVPPNMGLEFDAYDSILSTAAYRKVLSQLEIPIVLRSEKSPILLTNAEVMKHHLEMMISRAPGYVDISTLKSNLSNLGGSREFNEILGRYVSMAESGGNRDNLSKLRNEIAEKHIDQFEKFIIAFVNSYN